MKEFGARLNELEPDAYDGPDAVDPRRYSVGVDIDDASFSAVRTLIERIEPLLQEKSRFVESVMVDFAVYQEDYENRFMTLLSFPSDFLGILHRHSMEIEVTIYGEPPRS